MVRTIIAHKEIKTYLEKCAEESKFSLGLIIGQPTHDKNYIVHLAKNSDVFESSDDTIHSESMEEGPRKSGISTTQFIQNINNSLVTNHFISVTKMIPGSFFVLGIFVVDEKNIFEDEASLKKIKLMLQDINTVLKHNRYLCGSFCSVPQGEKLLLSYSTLQKSIVCKVFGPKEGGGYFMPTDWKFVEKFVDWHMFETNYELDDVFPIHEKENKINIEYHFGLALELITGSLNTSEIFIQNEPVDQSQLLDQYIKQKINKQEIPKTFPVNIYLPALPSTKDPIVVEKFDGLIRFSGIVSSRIWAHSRNSFEEIVSYIRYDILRSLSSRIQIYCDGLIDQNASAEAVIVSEPPRRVYFDVPNSGGIQFSEYIFRGETPSIAAAQAKDILDLDIDSETIYSDLEGIPDDESFSLTTLVSQTIKPNNKKEFGRLMYMAGLGTAILILVISIVLHFMLR